jgi:uncharacterized protein (TIGR03437 family)
MRPIRSMLAVLALLAGPAAERCHAVLGDGGPATQAALASPVAVAVDMAGNLYIADTMHHAVRKVTPAGIITTIAGTGEAGNGADTSNSPMAVALNAPRGVAVARDGTVFIADTGNRKVRRLSTSGELRTVLLERERFTPFALALNPQGQLYMANEQGHRVSRNAESQAPQHVLGTGEAGYNGEGPIFDAQARPARQINRPTAIAFDATGTLYLADAGNGRIRQANGLAPGVGGSTFERHSVGALLSGLAADPAGILYYALLGDPGLGSQGQNRVFRLDGGQATVVAGAGSTGFSGDGGPATAAALDRPHGLAVDAAGNLYIADTGNHRVRRVTSEGIIETVAGGFPEPFPESLVGAGLSRPLVEAISPGAIVSLFGRFLAPQGQKLLEPQDLVNGRVPTQLGGVCVDVDGQPGRIFHVFPGQINFQAPAIAGLEAAGMAGRPVQVRVRIDCGNPGEFVTSSLTVTARKLTPEFFSFVQLSSGVNPIAAINESRGQRLVGPRGLLAGAETEPAGRGDVVTLFMTGLGATDPAYEPGDLPPAAARTVEPVLVSLGQITRIQPIYAGVAPNFAGLYQVAFQVPFGAARGNQPVRIQVGGDPNNAASGWLTPSGGYLAIE